MHREMSGTTRPKEFKRRSGPKKPKNKFSNNLSFSGIELPQIIWAA
jgi:hypothetical protein